MKTIYKFLLILGLLLPFAVCSAQNVYLTSEILQMESTDPSAFIGNSPADDSVSMDAADGWMNVFVNLHVSEWSVLWDYQDNCWPNRMVFNANNRYVEFRLKSPAAFSASLSLGWGNNDGCPTSDFKMWNNASPNPIPFKYTSTSDDWQIFLLTVPKTSLTIDSMCQAFAFNLPDGNYTFDYALFGDAAVPAAPSINQVSPSLVADNQAQQTVALSGIAVGNRPASLKVPIDGLKITASERMSPGYFQDISFLDYTGGGDYINLPVGQTTGQATLYYTPIPGMYSTSVGAPNGDSIIVTVTDTIRNVTKTMEFWVSLLPSSLNEESSKVSVYPCPATDHVDVNFGETVTGSITLTDVIGNVILNKKVVEQRIENIPLSGLASGIYILRISDGSKFITKEISKQ